MSTKRGAPCPLVGAVEKDAASPVLQLQSLCKKPRHVSATLKVEAVSSCICLVHLMRTYSNDISNTRTGIRMHLHFKAPRCFHVLPSIHHRLGDYYTHLQMYMRTAVYASSHVSGALHLAIGSCLDRWKANNCGVAASTCTTTRKAGLVEKHVRLQRIPEEALMTEQRDRKGGLCSTRLRLEEETPFCVGSGDVGGWIDSYCGGTSTGLNLL